MFKLTVIAVLGILAYTKYGMFFPKGSDVYLHTIGGILLGWIFENPLVYFTLCFIAEFIQPVLIPQRKFDTMDLVCNLIGAFIYFLLTEIKIL